jgi:MFS family permease
MYELSTAYP